MKKLLIHGCGGKMGRTVAELAGEHGFTVVAGIDKYPGEAPFPVYGELADCPVAVDVVIDFSRPDSLPSLLNYVQRTHTPAVIATTGFSDEELAVIADASKSTALFVSANMSLGINLVLDLCKRAASFLGDGCDVEIIEKHHNQKMDSPSGTALALAHSVNEAYLNSKTLTFGRHGGQTKRSRGEIGIHAVRGGNIVGDHDVLFIAPQEVVTLSHSAQTRAVFASGALAAAAFLCGKQPGLYSMQHLLLASSAVTNIYTDEEQVLFCLSGLRPAGTAVHELFQGLTRENVNVDMINQTDDGKGALAMGISLPRKDSLRAMDVVVDVFSRHPGRFLRRDDVLKIVVEGEGMAAQSGVAARFYAALSSAHVSPLIVTTSDTSICCCIRSAQRREALESLLSEFNL
ncbi:MAG: 4-hydroxy-tetrahydrodipicolinate reductase [Eubacteriales bacterium]|nr:4-hydroxy-tetrahydrodipicolinate reductase [Eubacteriales bacterium]